MAGSLSLLVASTLLLPQVVLGHTSFRTVSGTRTVTSKPCSCDCCLIEQEDQAVQSAVGALKCAPRSAAFAQTDADSGCSDTCMLPTEMRAAYESENGEADYSRYCMSQCKPVGAKLHELCVDGSLVQEASATEEKKPESVAKPKQAMAQVGSEVATQAAGASEQALVLLAKQKMEEAKLQAVAAGNAAYTARTAYERLKLAQDEMSVLAAKTTLDEIKAEAAQQSKKALNIRLAYEKNAQATATKNAVAAAQVYAKAMTRDQALAGVWQERAGQYATAANQREKMAMDFSAEAEEYRTRGNEPLAKQRIVMAHQAMDQAAAFGAQSDAANKQANAIASSEGWYKYAKRAIAAFMLAKSMPHDVPPPPMPPIP